MLTIRFSDGGRLDREDLGQQELFSMLALHRQAVCLPPEESGEPWEAYPWHRIEHIEAT